MRLVLQRVRRAAVTIAGRERREIGPGLLVLVGVCEGDDEKISAYMADKTVHLRIFADDNGNMNRSLLEVGGACMIISQFTLYANSRKGRRPSFAAAAPPEISKPIYEHFVLSVRDGGVTEVATGEFGAEMQVELVNDGPVTILLDSSEIMPGK